MLDENDPPEGWEALTSDAREALENAWNCGVPGEASALHGRCWQLETWLRTLAYVELRARFAETWLDQIPDRAKASARSEAKLAHMTSPDANLILSYLDVAHLYDVIADNWQVFEPSLIDREIWTGRVRELKQIRHRIAHFRRPHQDDLPRIEQTLRDLDGAAVQAIRAYNTRYQCPRDYDDPIVAAWVRGEHRLAGLLEHAERRYGIYAELTFSRRPWARPTADVDPITGEPGYLWHIRFCMRKRGVLPRELWQDDYLVLSGVRDRLVFLALDGPDTADFAFPAAAEPVTVANDIGSCMEAILSASHNIDDYEQASRLYRRQSLTLDPRIQIATPWVFLGDHISSLTMFGA